MIENNVSIVLGFIEIFFFSGICFGFPFLQYTLEEEGVFAEELCESFNVNGSMEMNGFEIMQRYK